MHPVCLISSAISPDDPDRPAVPAEIAPGICAVTGHECDTVQRSMLLGKSFVDGALLAAPESDRVGVDAYVAMKYKWERMSSWICSSGWHSGGKFVRLDRIGVRNAVFGDPPSGPWCAYATTSYKKHGSLRTVVNSGGRRVWLFESRLVDCTDMRRVSRWWRRLDAAFRAGLGRGVLETMVCPAHVMRSFGIREWMEFEAWAAPRHRSALYAFLCYLLPSRQELKKEEKNGKQDPRPGADVQAPCQDSGVQGKVRQLTLFPG